ncbi:TatD family hydrolase [uncultured Porphyromonas sp.]|uniref:TatD family hydrolase n=1 Tax=uncultured Porphyromonas sp. TaxID=159274 RepID=UPI0026348E93|nr:TatD family hydrolase [uncultured Porphyromonas sp.]
MTPEALQFPYVDAHTHWPDEGDVTSLQIQSLHLSEAAPERFAGRSFVSIGLHPWQAEDLTEGSLLLLEQKLLTSPRVVALGEAGLDRICDTPYSKQLHFFREEARLADRLDLPLIIHLVRAQEDILRLKKELRPHSSWLIHGFRGKPEQAAQLLRSGFYLSFGRYFHSESLALAYGEGRAFLETDDVPDLLISSVYSEAAHSLGLSVEELREKLYDQALTFFPRLLSGGGSY